MSTSLPNEKRTAERLNWREVGETAAKYRDAAKCLNELAGAASVSIDDAFVAGVRWTCRRLDGKDG